MNTSSRVPGVSRNSGWQAIDAEIDARRQQGSVGTYLQRDAEPTRGRRGPASPGA